MAVQSLSPAWLLHLLLLTARIKPAAAPVACEYQLSSTVRFLASDGYTVTRGTTQYEVTTTSLNVGFGSSGVSTIDIFSPTCQFGNCPVILKGFNLDRLLPDADSANTDVFCYFGDELPCSSVPTNIRSDELACASPTLPAHHAIVPFGLIVLGPSATEPGILYLPDGLELTFFDSSQVRHLPISPTFSHILHPTLPLGSRLQLSTRRSLPSSYAWSRSRRISSMYRLGSPSWGATWARGARACRTPSSAGGMARSTSRRSLGRASTTRRSKVRRLRMSLGRVAMDVGCLAT